MTVIKLILLDSYLEISQNNAHITILFYQFQSWLQRLRISNFFSEIGLTTVEISMLKYVKTWLFCCFTYSLTSLSMKARPFSDLFIITHFCCLCPLKNTSMHFGLNNWLHECFLVPSVSFPDLSHSFINQFSCS